MAFYTQSTKNTCIPLGSIYNGVKVTPSEKIYYGDFQFKLCFDGNQFHYDILFLSDLINTIHKDTWHYRMQMTSKSINIYLHEKDALDNVIKRYQHTDYLKSLHAPLDQDHLDSLLDSDTEYVYRNKYWYGNYPIKISLFRRFQDEVSAKEISDFIKGSFDEYRLHDSYSDKWYVNYLWLTYEEFKKGYPFLKLSYGDYIDKIQKVKLLEK